MRGRQRRSDLLEKKPAVTVIKPSGNIPSQRKRYSLVVLGLVAAEYMMAMRPVGDSNGDVSMFPDAIVWFAAILLSWAVLMTGMFSDFRGKHSLGPLVLGTVGAAVLIAVNM